MRSESEADNLMDPLYIAYVLLFSSVFFVIKIFYLCWSDHNKK